jgi:adenylyl cyclase-associated protein
LVKKAFDAHNEFLSKAKTQAKPTDISPLLKPISDIIQEIVKLSQMNRSSPFFNHLSTVTEGIPSLGWLAVEPKPAPFIGEMKDAATFYSNRILKEWKDKDKNHVEWANSFISILLDLQTFVKNNHTTGLKWSSSGSPAKAPVSQPVTSQSSAPSNAKPLLGELNKGLDVTAGLKKVEKSQMTHKNPELRGNSTHKSVEQAGVTKEGKTVLEGNKWVIEGHSNNKNVIVSETSLKQVVYIYGCNNSTIQIKGKVNAVTLDGCKKSAVVVESGKYKDINISNGIH